MKQSDMNNAITMAQSVFTVYQRSAKTVELISRNRAHSAERKIDPVSGWSRPPATMYRRWTRLPFLWGKGERNKCRGGCKDVIFAK